MVARNKIGGGNLRQGPAQGDRVAPGRLAVLVLEVAGEKNIVRPGSPDAVDEIPVVLPEQGPVEIRELHNHAAVEALRQPGGGEGERPHLQGVVAPPEKSGAQGAQEQKRKQAPGPAAPPAALSCHG